MSDSSRKYLIICLIIAFAFAATVFGSIFIAVRVAPAPTLTPAPNLIDTDGDGFTDAQDTCPTVPGISMFNGCPTALTPSYETPIPIAGPDQDADGVIDSLDYCPAQAGTAVKNGCP